jgi:hypothetical protein
MNRQNVSFKEAFFFGFIRTSFFPFPPDRKEVCGLIRAGAENTEACDSVQRKNQ